MRKNKVFLGIILGLVFLLMICSVYAMVASLNKIVYGSQETSLATMYITAGIGETGDTYNATWYLPNQTIIPGCSFTGVTPGGASTPFYQSCTFPIHISNISNATFMLNNTDTVPAGIHYSNVSFNISSVPYNQYSIQNIALKYNVAYPYQTQTARAKIVDHLGVAASDINCKLSIWDIDENPIDSDVETKTDGEGYCYGTWLLDEKYSVDKQYRVFISVWNDGGNKTGNSQKSFDFYSDLIINDISSPSIVYSGEDGNAIINFTYNRNETKIGKINYYLKNTLGSTSPVKSVDYFFNNQNNYFNLTFNTQSDYPLETEGILYNLNIEIVPHKYENGFSYLAESSSFNFSHETIFSNIKSNFNEGKLEVNFTVESHSNNKPYFQLRFYRVNSNLYGQYLDTYGTRLNQEKDTFKNFSIVIDMGLYKNIEFSADVLWGSIIDPLSKLDENFILNNANILLCSQTLPCGNIMSDWFKGVYLIHETECLNKSFNLTSLLIINSVWLNNQSVRRGDAIDYYFEYTALRDLDVTLSESMLEQRDFFGNVIGSIELESWTRRLDLQKGTHNSTFRILVKPLLKDSDIYPPYYGDILEGNYTLDVDYQIYGVNELNGQNYFLYEESGIDTNITINGTNPDPTLTLREREITAFENMASKLLLINQSLGRMNLSLSIGGTNINVSSGGVTIGNLTLNADILNDLEYILNSTLLNQQQKFLQIKDLIEGSQKNIQVKITTPNMWIINNSYSIYVEVFDFAGDSLTPSYVEVRLLDSGSKEIYYTNSPTVEAPGMYRLTYLVPANIKTGTYTAITTVKNGALKRNAIATFEIVDSSETISNTNKLLKQLNDFIGEFVSLFKEIFGFTSQTSQGTTNVAVNSS